MKNEEQIYPTPKKPEEKIENFILENHKKGRYILSVLDFCAALGIEAKRVEEVLSRFEKEGRIKEIR